MDEAAPSMTEPKAKDQDESKPPIGQHLMLGNFRVAVLTKWSQSERADQLPTVSTPHERLVGWGLSLAVAAFAAWGALGSVEQAVRTDRATVERDVYGQAHVVAGLTEHQARRLSVGMPGTIQVGEDAEPVPVVVSAIERLAEPSTDEVAIARLTLADPNAPDQPLRVGDALSLRVPFGEAPPAQALLDVLLL